MWQRFCVKGAELSTKVAYGFDRYTFRVRMATTSADPSEAGNAVSGNISAAFSFVNDSETEIDFELEAYDPTRLTVGNWRS